MLLKCWKLHRKAFAIAVNLYNKPRPMAAATNHTTTTPTPTPRGKCEFLREDVLASGEWLSLSRTTYRDAAGRERQWESAGRNTRHDAAQKADAVAVVAILKRNLHFDFVVCIKQYRPPLRAYTIEFPAGLIDPGETPGQAALRELAEETGYSATITHVSPTTSLDPGAESATMVLASVEVNGDLPENRQPRQKLAGSEDIEVVLLRMDAMMSELQGLSERGSVVDSRVWSYALAVSMATREPSREIRDPVVEYSKI